MRELHRSPRTSRSLATPLWLLLALVFMPIVVPAFAHAQSARVMTLEEAGTDKRVDPILRLMVLRASQQADQPVESMTEAVLAETGGLANFLSAVVRPGSPVSVIIEGRPDRAQLESSGIVVGTVAGDVVTATLPLSLVPALLAMSGVERVSAAAPVEKALNVSAYEIDADNLWLGI